MIVKAAVVQASPVFFNKEKTIEKVATITAKYAEAGVELIVFPESFIPGYPRGFDFGTKVGSRTSAGRDLYALYRQNSIDLESEDLKQLEEIARSNNVYLVIGVTEQNKQHGSLYCAMLYLSPTAGLMGVHRKIKPTGQERVIWAEAAGESLVTFQTKIGKMGGLICWENYMPLARMAMYEKGVELYIAPTADSREGWTATMQHIALEGRCFVLACNQYFTKSMYPDIYQSQLAEEPEECCRGGSLIVSPLGEILAGPLWDESGGLVVELDMDEIPRSRLDFDVVGHYARKDIFDFQVNGQPDMGIEETG